MFALNHPAIGVVATSLLALLVSVSATAQQVSAGRELYDSSCASCHGGQLEGSEAAGPLIGHSFRSKWNSDSLTELDTLIRNTMPIANPGGLTDTEYALLFAFVVSQNDGSNNDSPAATEEVAMIEWLHHRGDPGAMNYSPLDIINSDNVAALQVAWRWRSDNFGPGIHSNLQTTPIMADGVLYATAGLRRDVVRPVVDMQNLVFCYGPGACRCGKKRCQGSG